MRSHIRFLRRGQVVELGPSCPPTRTVLDYLRLEERSRGTKEGCNEGDCGACTVALGTLRGGKLLVEPVNACILFLAHLDGKELVTVDDLASDGTLHPVQQALVEHHASQCGFCTPGFVMSLFTLYHGGHAPTRRELEDRIAGNLCRCTGYRPILDAAASACSGVAVDRWAERRAESMAILARLDDGSDLFCGTADNFVARPGKPETLTRLAARHPDAILVAGATDIGLWVTKQMKSLPKIIMTGGVADLHQIEEGPDLLSLGAAVTYAEAESCLGRLDADVAEVLRRIGSAQVRASGTIGGNIANGSPIGDMPPMLIALGARLQMRSGDGSRDLPLEDYFVAYGKQDRQPGEILWRIDIPRLSANQVFRSYKISKRFDQDISAVMAAFRFTLEGRRVAAARIAFGGMAATPRRAAGAELAVAGLSLDDTAAWDGATAALADDFQPISDMRATAGYRTEVAQGLLRKALTEIAGMPTSVTRLTGFRRERA
ncbi:MAG: xanthine dehydrogenase small subunit [Alphaproteobacteria bacterium]|nr:xanthine dehydrogenase small subunit [Alphaproteobacteria bacterium]